MSFLSAPLVALPQRASLLLLRPGREALRVCTSLLGANAKKDADGSSMEIKLGSNRFRDKTRKRFRNLASPSLPENSKRRWTRSRLRDELWLQLPRRGMLLEQGAEESIQMVRRHARTPGIKRAQCSWHHRAHSIPILCADRNARYVATLRQELRHRLRNPCDRL